MKLSEKRRQAIYNAVANPIMDLRVAIKMGKVKDIDDALFRLEIKAGQDALRAAEGSPSENSAPPHPPL